MELSDNPKSYVGRPTGQQWCLRVVLLFLAYAAEKGQAADCEFWLRVSEITTKIQNDPDEDHWV